MAAGRSRNISVARSRLHKYKARMGKLRMLRRSGVSTARLVRTGLKAMTYGTEILGVGAGMLRSQRQTIAAVTAPGHGTGGQNLDLALMLADGKAGGRADPAYDAHAGPIGQWAMAVWEAWEHTCNLNRMINYAKTSLEEAANKWAAVRGPAATLVQTCARIGWQVVDATKLITDIGEELALQLDPPIVVIKKCHEAVQRWRWKRVEEALPQLGKNGSGRGAVMEPIWSLLNSKSKAAEWTAQHRGSLGSAVAGRQYPQTRVMRNGWAAHNKCIFCLHDIVEKEKGECCGGEAVTRGSRDPVIATAEQIAKAPVGSLVHRNWSCPKHDGLRKEHTSEADRRTVVDANVQGHPAWERALVARPPPPRKKKAAVESFKWHVQPQALPI
jgi:hypothetical protein